MKRGGNNKNNMVKNLKVDGYFWKCFQSKTISYELKTSKQFNKKPDVLDEINL